MKNLKLITASLSLAMSLTALAAEPQTGTGETDGYTLVWQDLFDDEELNLDRWNIEVTGSGGGNNELQYYTNHDSNVHLGDDGEGNGCLILTAIKESFSGKTCTSGRINSKGKIAFKHGKVEAAIKLPQTANGLWPAFWMMGNDYDEVGWPQCGETDIMEFGNSTGIAQGTQDRYFNGACHWGPSSVNHPNYSRAVTYDYSLQDGEFHIYTCIWNEERIAMYVDLDKYPDVDPYFEMTIPESTDEYTPGTYFHKENFILFNLAIGGDFTGIWDIDGITALNEDNNYQQSMYVNYVKIYQKGTSDETTSFADPGDMNSSGVALITTEKFDIRYAAGTIILPAEGIVEVYSMSGTKVAEGYGQTVNVDNINAGIYIVRANLADGRSSTIKIVVK